MTYKVTYNGFGTGGGENLKWDHIKVQQYSSRPLFSEDDQTHWTTHHVFSFTALLQADSGNIDDVLNNCRTKLSKQGRLLVIQVNDGTADNDIARTGVDTSSNLSDLTTSGDVAKNSDQRMYPRVEFDITEFYGNKNAMVSVTFEWRESTADTLTSGGGHDDAENQWFVLSHQWRQSFTIEENGLQTYKVDGTIHVKPYLNASEGCTNGTEVMHGTNPDSYRRVVMPIIPSGFRIKTMNWAIDPTGAKLIYSITMHEHARMLPKPGKVGTGSFRFKQSLIGEGIMGTKIFHAELEGDAKCDERMLLAALLQASTARISWVDHGDRKMDLIQSVEIREIDIFSKKRIGITVIAKGLDPNIEKALKGDFGSANFGIHTPLVAPGQESIAPDAYGSALIGAIKKALFITHGNYVKSTFPKAAPIKIDASDTTGTDPYSSNTMGSNECAPAIDESVYSIPTDTTLPDVGEGPNPGDLTGDLHADDESEISQEGKVLKVVGSERLGVKHNITVFSTGGTANAYQIPWQTAAPEIYLESEYTITRHDKPPPMLQYKLPGHAIVLDEQTSVDSGQLDGNGHRIYTRHLKRKVQLLYGFDGDHVVENSTVATWTLVDADVSVTLNYSYPSFSKLFRAHDMRTDDTFNIESATVFTGITGAGQDEFFPVDFSLPLG